MSKPKFAPSIFKPLKIRCQSPILRMKFSRPKISVFPNNFIVTKLSKPLS